MNLISQKTYNIMKEEDENVYDTIMDLSRKRFRSKMFQDMYFFLREIDED